MPTALALPCFVQIGTNFNFGSGFSTVTLPAFTDLATTDFFRIVNGGTGNTAGQITGVSTKIVPPSDVLCPVGETVREDDRDRAPPRSAGAITSHKHQIMRIEDCERKWIAGVVVMVASYRELASECLRLLEQFHDADYVRALFELCKASLQAALQSRKIGWLLRVTADSTGVSPSALLLRTALAYGLA